MRPRAFTCGLLALFAPTAAAAGDLPVFGDIELGTALRSFVSAGQIRYGFFKGGKAANPTSALDWKGLAAVSGEIEIDLRHRPTGLFLRGLGGFGTIDGGTVLDRDFRPGPISFSATTSTVSGATLDYGIVDVGVARVALPKLLPALTLGPFAGYHRWSESPIARGVFCAPSDISRADCAASATGVLYPESDKALRYATTWDALRLGLDVAVPLFGAFSLRGDAAFVPYARLAVDDSHYLRQGIDPALGLGPVPNVFIRGAGRGAEIEAFLDYAPSPTLTLGAGARYWGLAADEGTVRNALVDDPKPVTRFVEERYGLLIELGGRF